MKTTIGRYYILRGKTPIPCDDLMEWAKWFETANRCVANDYVGKARVSTVFLGVDHGYPWLELGPSKTYHPALFETMIFGGKHDDYQTRCSTWEQAEAMHADALKLVKELVKGKHLKVVK